MKIKLIKFNGFETPKRAHYNDSGADVFAAADVIIPAGSVVKVPTGVGVELPDGYDIVVHCKSGLSSKGIYAANAPVDAGYRGEIHAILYNTTNKDFIIQEGDKIGQFVVRPVIYAEFVENLGDERGDNGFGSTGK
jgi:dUTP pyrophosphatase